MSWSTADTYTVGQTLGAASLNKISGDLSVLGGPMTSYTSTWASSGTQPAIGNGSITSAAVLTNKMVDFRIAVVFGTSTTFGTGSYTLSLPATSVVTHQFRALGWVYQGGVRYPIDGLFLNSSTLNLIYQATAGSSDVSVTPTAPVTLTATAGNGIFISGRYEAA